MAITDVPIIGYYDQQRFKQFNPASSSNWYIASSNLGKKKAALYPAMGRQHINYLNENKLIFATQPRAVYKSVNYWYSIVGDHIYRIDKAFNQIEITASLKLSTLEGDIFFDYLVAGDPSIPGNTTYAVFCDGVYVYIYSELDDSFGVSTDTNTPKKPIFIATFGNRIAVSGIDSSTFSLSEINLRGGAGGTFDLAKVFTINGAAVFAQETDPIRQMGVLQNTLYIFKDFNTGIWSNIPSTFVSFGGIQTTFPWKKNTTYEFDYGISNPKTLDVSFGMIGFEGKSRNGLIQIMVSTGGRPEAISSKAMDVLLQAIANAENADPSLITQADGFFYSYENTIFYRWSYGDYVGYPDLDHATTAVSMEYNFDTQTWGKVIEPNGERCRIQDHVFFNNRHLVTVEGEGTVYEMSGQFYTNEIDNPLQTNKQAVDAYIQEPFRYERITSIICNGLVDVLKGGGFYDEFITDFLEIDFVWGDGSINSTGPYDNAVFIIDEEKDMDGNTQFIVSDSDTNTFVVSEQGNYPVLDSDHYHAWFKPHVELYFSNDGGVSFESADVMEFSQIGQFQWRMRWYQLGTSRNRVYKLVCVSPFPIVVLGGQMDVRRASGGAA